MSGASAPRPESILTAVSFFGGLRLRINKPPDSKIIRYLHPNGECSVLPTPPNKLEERSRPLTCSGHRLALTARFCPA